MPSRTNTTLCHSPEVTATLRKVPAQPLWSCGFPAPCEDVAAIRPAIQADEGDIELIGVDEESGVVTVELMGACVTCPASTQTLKAGIERIMKDRVEGVTEVVEINSLGMSESAVSL